MYTDAVGTTWRRRLGRARVMGIATVVLATTLGLGAIVASPGGATTTKPSMGQAEKELAALEALAPASPPTLTEAGSSLFYPLWQEWAAATPPVPVTPGKGGSGLGQSEAENGTINIGASDGFLPKATLTGPPAVENIPVVVSGQDVVYNLPGVKTSVHLKLNAKILAGIYDGSITTWTDPAIVKLNPRVKLPAKTIVPIRRVDSSGDTFLFTSYLYYGDSKSWVHNSPYDGPQLLYSSWPTVTGELSESGNSGILAGVQANQYSISYLGNSYLPAAESTTPGPALGWAALLNGSGNFELPTPRSIDNEVNAYKSITANGAMTLIDSRKAPNGYPDVNFEYAIVLKSQPSEATAHAVVAELAWGMDPKHGAANSFLDSGGNPLLFRPLPLNALEVAIKLLQKITY